MAGPAAKAVEGKKIPRGKPRAGSNPAPGTTHYGLDYKTMPQAMIAPAP